MCLQDRETPAEFLCQAQPSVKPQLLIKQRGTRQGSCHTRKTQTTGAGRALRSRSRSSQASQLCSHLALRAYIWYHRRFRGERGLERRPGPPRGLPPLSPPPLPAALRLQSAPGASEGAPSGGSGRDKRRGAGAGSSAGLPLSLPFPHFFF